ncbi:hypothetical protein FQN57_004353 [Myotisia sp. PD_48]|nr:hypothetical protein FQN57_004353 [Myotisia sp. PD_48]
MDNTATDVVFVGFWIDHDKSLVGKYQLTLKTRPAFLLLALLTVLVTLSANRSWKVWSFFVHAGFERIRSKYSTVPTYARQQQVILRNSETAGGGFWALTGLETQKQNDNTSWKHQKGSFVRHRLPLLCFTLLHWAAFIALGILTSQIVAGRTVRSLDTKSCGPWAVKNFTDLENTTLQEAKVQLATYNELALNATLEADDYVRNCYSSHIGGVIDCGRLVKRSLPYATRDTQCVFSDELCSSVGGVAVALDSGKIPFSTLGLNTPMSHMLSVRRRTVCSPIPSEPFIYSREQIEELATTHVIDDVDEVIIYSHVLMSPGSNWTMAFRNNTSDGYDLTTAMAMDASLAPVLLKPQGQSMQVSIVTLRGGVIAYREPFSDPMFYFQQRFDTLDPDGANYTFYRMGELINSVACQEMIQYCSEYTGDCTNWEGIWEEVNIPKLLGNRQNQTHEVLSIYAVRVASLHSSIFDQIGGRGRGALQATRFLHLNEQLRLFDGQWKIELEGWFKVALARIQLGVFRLIKIPNLDVTNIYNLWDEFPILKPTCSLIKFNSSEHTTLSTIGVMMVLICSVLLTIISYWELLLPKCFPKKVLASWNKDDNLELLEVTQTANGEGGSGYRRAETISYHQDSGQKEWVDDSTTYSSRFSIARKPVPS